jgi:hypothetical protein
MRTFPDPQEASQGTFQCMVCAGVPPQPGVWFISKEEAVCTMHKDEGRKDVIDVL